MRSRCARVGALLSLVLAAAALSPAVAHAESAPADLPEVAVPEDSVLASPEDVARLGGTAAEIERQRAAWDALSPEIRAQQEELHRSQDALFAGAWTNRTAHSPFASGTGKSVTPLAYKTSCTSGTFSQYYKIDSDNKPMRCFTGAPGYYDLTSYAYGGFGTTNGTRISTGTHTCGRVYYYKGTFTQYYWSTSRAYDPAWYSNFGYVGIEYNFGLKKLQLQDC